MTKICLIGFLTQTAAMPFRTTKIQTSPPEPPFLALAHQSMAIINAFRLGLGCLCMYTSSNETQPDMPPSLYIMIINATIYPESQLVYSNRQYM